MLRNLCSTAFIIVIESDLGIELSVFSTKGKRIAAKYNRIYEEPQGAKRFLEQVISGHYFCYVAQMFKSIGQGILPTLDKKQLVKFGIEATNIGLLRLDGFYVYASKSEIELAKSCCDKLLESDLLYSPFNILHVLSAGHKRRGCNLFLLKYKNLVAVVIYKDAQAKFGNYFELKSSKTVTSDNASVNEPISGIDEPLANTEDFDELTFDDLDDVNVSSEDDLVIDDLETNESGSLENFDTEMAIFDYLKTAVREFYENELYESDFIDEIHIYEHDDSSSAFLAMIRTELFINPQVHKIDLFYEIFALACNDLGVKIDS